MQQIIYAGPVYKYISTESFEKVITSETLWFTRGDCFNDPYEANPYMIPIEWKDIVKVDKSNVDLILEIANNAFVRICSKIYSTCFSKRSNSQLMWSHYADSHRGLCFGMNLPEPDTGVYKPGDPVPVAVTYCPSLFNERENRNMKSEDLPLYMATFKSDEWAYEREVRMVLHVDAYGEDRLQLVNGGKNASVGFNISEIDRVIFGARMSGEHEEKIIKLFCAKGHLPEFYKMDLNPVTLEFFEERLPIRDEIIAYNKKLKNSADEPV